MLFYLNEDTLLLFASVLLGFLIGLYYEIFRFIRLSFHHSSLLIGIEDLFFFLPVTFIFLFFCYAFSSGLIRWFALLGTALGFFIYLLTLGKLLLFCSDRILFTIRKILSLISRFLFRPIFNVFKNITIYFFTKAKKFVIIQNKKKSARRLKKKKKALVKKAEKGF